MQHRRVRTGIHAIGILVLGVVLLTNVFGVTAHATSTGMDEGGTMLGCLFMGETAMCQMNALEHLSLWRNTFTSIVSVSASLALLLILAWFIRAYRERYGAQQIAVIHPLCVLIEPDADRADYLKQALSQGILHPKIY